MIQRIAGLVIATTTVAGIVLLADIEGPVRAVAVLSFFLTTPGLAAIGFFEPLRADTRITLVLAISIVTTVVVSQVLLYTDNWTPELGYTLVALVSLVALSVQVVEALARRLGTSPAQRLGDGRDRDPAPGTHQRPENLHTGSESGVARATGSGHSSS